MNELALMREINKMKEEIQALRTIETSKPGWEDLRFAARATQVNPATSLPHFDWTNNGFLFDASSTETVYLVGQMPHHWVAGSNVEPHIHWMPTNTNTGDVRWQLEYKVTNIDAVESGSWTTVPVDDAGAGVAYTHQLASFGELSFAGITASAVITMKISRLGAADTYNADALYKEFDIHYTQYDGNVGSLGLTSQATFLQTPYTSTSWDGDSFSTTANTKIDLSAVFGVPAGIKAVQVAMAIRDSGSSGADCFLFLKPADAAGFGAAPISCSGLPNDVWTRGSGIIPCDSNGDIWYQIGASGAGTLEVYIWIWGYWV